MNWECNNCSYSRIEYACFGHGSQVDDGCPKCGCRKIWFYHFGYPASKPSSRWLIDIDTNKVLKKQIVHVKYSFTYSYSNYE